MKSVRLLPVVICAGLALLAFKGIGLVTEGGYVLSGSSAVQASGEAAHGAPAAAEGDDAPVVGLPAEPTMSDTGLMLDDHAPTLGATPAGEHGEAAPHDAPAAEHGEPVAAEADPHGEPAVAEAAVPEAAPHGEAAAHEVAPVVPGIDCPSEGDSLSTSEIGASIAGATNGEGFVADPNCPIVDPRADALAVTENSDGTKSPLNAADDGMPLTEKVLLERLAERRNELDAWEGELAARLALVEAAEKRIDERSAALQALETQIGALLDQKKDLEDAELKSLVGIYESMKPGEAAAIFNNLDMGVLLRLARGMSPRKMAPIMAKMAPARAQELTSLMVDKPVEAVATASPSDLNNLPQIVGQ